jgi:hypothetical protein
MEAIRGQTVGKKIYRSLRRTHDAGSAHDNGAANDGTTSLASGTTCTTTFSGGYTVSGTAAYKAGTLTPVTCQVNPFDADYAPDYGATIARPSVRPEPHTH